MITVVLQKDLAALPKRMARLEREVKSLRDVIINASLGRDPEGEYKPEFIKEVLASLKDKPIYRFRDKESFLKQIRSIK